MMAEELTEITGNSSEVEGWMQQGAEYQQEYEDNQEIRQELEAVDLAQEEASKDQGLLPNNPIQAVQEVGSALVGGAADAVESVGGLLELSGDTWKAFSHRYYGTDLEDTQNPFSDNYIHNDGNWLDIPDHLVPENRSGLGKLSRGLVEFGLLAYATGGVGGWTTGAAKTGVRLAAAGRAAGIGHKGVKAIRLIHKGTVIGAEGAIADIISSSSETANIANLVNEHAPWVPFSEALAIDPEKDNPWIARIKTATAGAGINHVGHFLAGYIKGSWRGLKARKAGATIEEANQVVNDTVEAEMRQGTLLDEAAATERAADNWDQGLGISNADTRALYRATYLDEAQNARFDDPLSSKTELDQLDEIADARGAENGDVWDWKKGGSTRQLELELGREPDSAVNPNLFADADKSTYRPDSPDPVNTNLRESIADMKAGGEGRSYNPLFTEAALKKMSRGDVDIRRYIVEVSEDLSREAFKSLDNTLNYKEVQELILRQASEIHGRLEDGGEAAVKQLKDYFKNNKKDGIIWMHDGNEVVTGTATQKAALQLVINTLAKQVQAIATGALDVAPTASLVRQSDQIFDAMKVALTEHKKIGFMTGTELATQKGISLSPNRAREINAGLEDITRKQDEFFNELKKLSREGKWKDRRDLMEMYELSGGKVRTLEDIHEYLASALRGGRMDGENIAARWRTELRSVFYNSILSSLKTPVKALAGTNLIAILRPFQAYLGAGLRGDKKEVLLAAAQIDAIGKAWAEGFQMFKHNWDLGINRQAQTYVGKFDFERDIADWKALRPFYENHGSPIEQVAYNRLDNIVDLNNNPWMRYSQNAMGAGDALARTIIGRMEMRMRAARAAMESGVDLDNVVAWANKYEEKFREQVFKQNENGKWVVSDKAAQLAGDEAAMTKALEGSMQGLELIARIPGMRAFFPFVRTGYNALRLSFGHTELNRFTAQFHDIMRGQNLEKYGIRPQDLPQAQALMRGRMAMGNSIIGMASIASLTGLMTGSYPMDKETRDLWRVNGIQPNSFKFGNAYISYDNIEPFNTIFTTTANVVAASHVLGEDMRDEMLEKLVFMTTAVIVDKSMLSGVEDLAQVLSADTAGGKLQRTGAKYLRAHLPYAGLLSQIGTIMDANQKEANTFLEQITQREAIYKTLVMKPKYDILSKDRSGKRLVVGAENPLLRFFNSISPVAVTFADGDPIKMGLKEMSYNLPEVMRSYQGEPLNSYERSELQRYMATGNLRKRLEHLMRDGGTWRRDLDAYKKIGLRQADGYDLVKQRFYQLVHRVFVEEKKIAMLRLRKANPDLYRRIELRKAKKRLSKSGSYGGTAYLTNEFPK